MRNGWFLLVVFCSISVAACAGTNKSGASVPECLRPDYLERQRVELQSSLKSFDGTRVERRENGVCIIIGSDSLFESNSDCMTQVTCKEIDTVAEVVKKYPDTKIKVDAHTDCIRSEEENLALSELQAWTIKKVLVDKGVASSRVIARGWGESKPAASNATEAGRKVNRRLTITLKSN